MIAMIRLHLTQILRGRARWALVAGMAIPILLSILLYESVNDDRPRDIVRLVAPYAFFVFALAGLSSLLLGTSILGAEVQDKTAVYLFTRAIPRWKIVVGKWLANVVVTSLTVLIGLSITWIWIGNGDAPLWMGMAAASVGSVVAYNAVFALIGAIITSRPLWSGFVWLGAVEIFIGLLPSYAQTFTVSYATRGLAFAIAGDHDLPRAVKRMIADSSVEHSLVTILVTTVVALVATCVVATNREYRLTDTA